MIGLVYMERETSFTASELADRLGGLLQGDGSHSVCSVATLEHADSDTVSWVGRPDLISRAAESGAGVILLPKGCLPPPGRTTITVDDPDFAICEIQRLVAPPCTKVRSGVHPTATVAADARIEGACVGAHVYVGAGVEVGQGTQLHSGVYVGDHSQIGRDCVLWPNVVVRERVKLGNRVVIHPNSTIGADGFGYLQRDGAHHKIPQTGTVVIEDDVEIGANTAVDRARTGVTRIGRGTKIDNLVQVGHNVDIDEHCIIVAGCVIGGSTSLGHHVFLSGQVGVTDHVHIGDGAQVSGKSSVMSDVPNGHVIRGIPAIDLRRFLRQEAAVRKLPNWFDRLRELTKRVARLESQNRKGADDQTTLT